MSKIIGFRAWYENDRIFDSKNTEWGDLPNDGLIVVMLYESRRLKGDNGHYRIRMANSSFYWVVPPNILDVFHDDEDPTERYPGAIIKLGKWVPHEEYEAVVDSSMNSLEF